MYVFFDTGIEYKATRQHLSYLRDKYHIAIYEESPIYPIPLSCKMFGQPFLSKYVSEQLGRLQNYGFDWTDEPYEKLIKKYPKCKSALKFWCNMYTQKYGFKTVSRYDIGYNKYLKSFIVNNPPNFNISKKCCDYAKKNVSHKFIKENDIDLVITGVRRAEGGIRATAYKTCFSEGGDGVDSFRPIWWWINRDKEEFEECIGIKHSDCYEKYGLARTGCVGCPYGFNSKQSDLSVLEQYEPNLYKAACNVFKDSYAYTKQYLEYKEKMKAIEKQK